MAGGSPRHSGVMHKIALLGFACFAKNAIRVHAALDLSAEEILLKIYDETRGLRWEDSSGWLQSADICDWHGVICYDEDESDKIRVGHIKTLDFAENNLVGEVPQDVFDLPYIQNLILRDNVDLDIKFDRIGDATHLRQLVLSRTGITTVDGIDDAADLRVLHLTDCGLRERFPSALHDMESLQYLYANYNEWTGTLSTRIGYLTDLVELYLVDNQFSGQIPSQLGKLTDLEVLALGENGFSGTLPDELGNLESLEILSVNRKRGEEKGPGISGSLPLLQGMMNLEQVYLEHQKLTGKIPSGFMGDASNREDVTVDLTGNDLTGTIPGSLERFYSLALYVADNKITGVDTSLCTLPDLKDWMKGDMGDFGPGCDSILCPAGTYGPVQGRQTTVEGCLSCTDTQYFGSTTCENVDLPMGDEQVLIKFFNAMGGDEWKESSNWLEVDSNYCDWHGIGCNDANEVTSIDLVDNDLSGSFPPETYQLSSLSSINLDANFIDFTFEGIEQATNLESLHIAGTGLKTLDGVEALRSTRINTLSLSSNALSAKIPSELFDLTSLTSLALSHNAFSGTLSSDFTKFSNLRLLHVYGTSIGGQIPEEFGLLSDLEELVLAENNFDGTIPTQLNQLTNLRELSLHQTTSASGMTGGLPAFTNLAKLEVLHLGSNNLGGTLPDSFLSGNTVAGGDIDVDLSDNKLEGPIPSSWADRFTLLYIDLSDNQIDSIDSSFCDKISGWMEGDVGFYGCEGLLCPKGTYNWFGRKSDDDQSCADCSFALYAGFTECDDSETNSPRKILERFYYATNGDDWAEKSNWMSADNICDWEGVYCNVQGDIESLDASENGLTGNVDPSIFELSFLKELDLNGNSVNINFDGIEKALSLETLYLSDNGLTSIAGISAAQSLKNLHLTANNLAGPLPAELFQMTNLETLFMNYNSLTGRLPSTVGQLTKLKELYLLGNKLNGQLPAGLGALSRLEILSLSENQFSGTLPVELNDLTSIEVLAIQYERKEAGTNPVSTTNPGTGITGPLLSFDKLKNLNQLYLGSNSLTGPIPFDFLEGVSDKNQRIKVDIMSNKLTGRIPGSLDAFSALSLYVAGNRITELSESLCALDDWMEGQVKDYKCDAILCPPNFYSEYGRQPRSDSGCTPCDQFQSAPFYGSFTCINGDGEQALAERKILEEFFLSLSGKTWKLQTNWNDPDVSFCDWHGITCISSGVESVESIHLSSNSLSGAVPDSTFNLLDLKELNLAGSPVQINFSVIGNAPKLTYLNVDETQLESIEGIENAKSLVLLHAMKNNFGGNFPTSIFSIPNLEVLYLSENDLGDTLPSTITNLSKLVFFSCFNCGFKGAIPQSLGLLTNLEYIRLDQNAFVGNLPTNLEQITKLQHLDLSDQVSKGGGITGSLLDFSGMGKLTGVYLQRNNLDGPIPATFLQSADQNELIKITLQSNQLTGTIPVDFATRFVGLSLDLADNKIKAIPTELCSVTGWNDGNVGEYGCQGLLCDPGFFSPVGRSTRSTPCVSCPETGESSTFYGSTNCGEDSEPEILKELFYATGGTNWDENDGWLSGDNVCVWSGVDCNAQGFVESLDLEENGLVGTFPQSVFNLAFLTDLYLKRNNELIITFENIGNAKKLQSLVLSETGVTTVTGIGMAQSLKELHLTSNDLTGPISDEIYQLPVLEDLFMNYAGLTGTLSTKIGQLTSLKNLYLFHNKLDTTIPTEIGLLTNLELLAIGENFFHGQIPNAINNLSNLHTLSMQREDGEDAQGVGGPYLPKSPNQLGGGLTGTLPAFTGLKNIRALYLGSNSIAGSIPSNFLSAITDKSATVKVGLSLNELTGPIPKSLANFADLRLYVAGNKINSETPSEICAKSDWFGGQMSDNPDCHMMLCPPGTYNEYGRHVDDATFCKPCAYTYMTEFWGSISCSPVFDEALTEREILRLFYEATGGNKWISRNNWLADSVSICKWDGVHCAAENGNGDDTVVHLELDGNGLTGIVPPVIFMLPNLRVFSVVNNEVGFLFDGIANAENFEELYLDSTLLTSLHGIGNAKNLKVLHIQQTDFGGKNIPDEVLGLQKLESLYISNSNFAGQLPKRIGEMTQLKEFFCHGNDFSGAVPTEIGSLTRLVSLGMSENDFEGSLPTEMNELSDLQALIIDSYTRNNIGLSGPLLNFKGLADIKLLSLNANSFTGTISEYFLEGILDPDLSITVGLASNRLTGTVPSSLGQRFNRLNIELGGNQLKKIGDGICEKTAWNGGAVLKYGCGGIMCAPGYFNDHGRQVSSEVPCRKCDGDDSEYFGSVYCEAEVKAQERTILEMLYNNCNGKNWNNNENWMDDSVDICHWYGITCHEGRTVDSILLGSNNLSGTPPKQIFELMHLKWLWLYANPINFKFDGIEKAERLTSLLLDSTGLKSLTGISNVPNLIDLDVRFNSLKGPLTTEISKLTKLETFSCAQNDLTGKVPSFASNRRLKSLRMGSNKFSGPVPSFANHPSLKALDLSDNRLDGYLPLDLLASADTSQVLFVDLSTNFLTGIIPAEFARFRKLTLYLRDNLIEGIAPALCDQGYWNDGDVDSFSCDGILCPIGTYSKNGRETAGGGSCRSCSKVDFFGATACTDAKTAARNRSDAAALSPNRLVAVITMTISTLLVLSTMM